MAGDEHRLRISASLAGQAGAATVHAVRGWEEVSRPFRYEVDLAAEDIAVEELRGTVAQLVLEDPLDRPRHVSGVVERIEVLAGEAAATRFRLHLVPLPYLLSFRHGFRIFQDVTAPEIVERVLRDAGLEARTWRLELAGSYPKREYCVQYDESEWDFVSRLLEEEGIWFTFEQSADGHVLVIGDASSKAPEASTGALAFDPGAGMHRDALRAWAVSEEARVSIRKVLVDDYDPLRPSLDLHAEEEAGDGHGTWYEYPARFAAPADGKRLAKSRLAELRGQRTTVRFTTNALGLQPGRRVEITEHPSLSGSWFVTGVTLHARAEEVAPGLLADPGPPESWLEVEAVAAEAPYRPPRRTPRPRVAGPQTARVTGPRGEEIHCDQHGRVKLQFHWDRDGALDDRSSCWVRVVQPHTTGAVMIPRIGWEVLVEFLEGDPDRPLCLGRLYNPLTPPPLDLPSQKTVTAHRSESSPGGGGVNELRFDDAAGSQQVLLSAHRNFVVNAAEKRTKRVGKNESRTVGVNRSDHVQVKETVSVTGDHIARVGAAQTISAGTRTVEVSGDLAEEVTNAIQLEVGGAEMVKVGDPVKALVQLAAMTAVQAATAAAQGFVDSAAAAVVAPLKPVMDKVSKAAGGLQAGGRAAAFLGGDPSKAVGPLPPQVQSALQSAGPNLDMAVSNAIAGAAAAAEAEASAKVVEALGPSDGNLALTVGQDLSETVGAVQVLTGLGGIAIGVGASSTERVGVARMEVAAGGRFESTGGSKNESVIGAYVVDTKTGIALTAGGNLNLVIGAQVKQRIGKGHALSAVGPAVVTASKLKLKAKGSITFKCGQAEVVLSGDGLSIKGTLATTVKASKVKLTPPAIKPG